MKWISLFTALLFLTACSSGKRVDLAREFGWLEGTWKLADAGSEVFESWAFVEGEWRGESYAAVGGMKVPTEKIRLYADGGTIVFSQRVKDRDDGAAVDFLLSQRSRKTWSFSNPDYAFPNVITYTRIGDKAMEVRISGARDGDPVEIALEYERQ